MGDVDSWGRRWNIRGSDECNQNMQWLPQNWRTSPGSLSKQTHNEQSYTRRPYSQMIVFKHAHTCIVNTERDRETDRDRERQTETETETDTETDRDSQTDRDETKTDRQRQRQTNRQTETETDKDRQT